MVNAGSRRRTQAFLFHSAGSIDTQYKMAMIQKDGVDFTTYGDDIKGVGRSSPDYRFDVEKNSPLIKRGPRIAPPLYVVATDSDTESELSVSKLVELESANSIKYRTCSWPKTAALLFSEYICLAIMSFPYSYSILGLVPGLILTVVVAGLVLYTSLIVW